MYSKDELFHWGVKVLKVVYPLAILYIIYLLIMMAASISIIPAALKSL